MLDPESRKRKRRLTEFRWLLRRPKEHSKVPLPWNVRVWFHSTRTGWDRIGLDVFTYFKVLHRCRTGERR